jgi:hypothetical protein
VLESIGYDAVRVSLREMGNDRKSRLQIRAVEGLHGESYGVLLKMLPLGEELGTFCRYIGNDRLRQNLLNLFMISIIAAQAQEKAIHGNPGAKSQSK